VIFADSLQDRLLRPSGTGTTRVLYLAESAPEEPDFAVKAHAGDGGYPAYYHEIWQCLKEIGYAVRSSSHISATLFSRGNADFVFSLYNRMPINNSEVLVSAFCEYARIPCLGARPNIRVLAEDKWLSKLAARAIGLPTTDGMPYADLEATITAPPFKGPYFVKDRFGAASEGITTDCLQDTWDGAKRIARGFLERGLAVLVEQFAPGIDVTVPILGGTPPMMLGFVNPVSDKPGSILTEDLKLNDPLGYRMYSVGRQEDKFRADATAFWAALGPIDYLRIDYRFDPATGARAFLEFNICCFIGSSGAICLAGAEKGLSQREILSHVIEFSLRRQRFGREHLEWVL
jgi:D-alanine-D-alanine ligase